MAEVFGGHHSHTGEIQQTPRLTTTLLNGTNYPSWVRSVYLFLHSKGKLSHITGKTEIPIEQKTSTEQTNLEWQQNDTSVMTWLLNSMEPQVSRLFMFMNSAKEIWDETKEMYGQDQNFSYILHLKQGTKTVTEYFSDLKEKWNELTLYTQTTDLKALQQDQIFKFLSDLHPIYESARAQILLSKELPTLKSVVAMILGEETCRTCMNS
jgi:gag-polypeptide of LTR copia-type